MRNTYKHRQIHKRTKNTAKSRRRRRTMKGRGYTSGPGYVGAPGNLIHTQYPTTGGTDCPAYLGTGVAQKGGRYEHRVEILNPESGIGTTLGISKIPCETSRLSGGVYVGDVHSMRYYAPTAGYANLPMNALPSNNPGVLMQAPYEARHYNKACIGGKKEKKRL